MFEQILISPQVKRSVMISNKHCIYELPDELSNDLKLRILGKSGKIRKISKLHRIIAQRPASSPEMKIPPALAKTCSLLTPPKCQPASKGYIEYDSAQKFRVLSEQLDFPLRYTALFMNCYRIICFYKFFKC